MQKLNVFYENLTKKYQVMLEISKMNNSFEENIQHTEDFNVESLEEFLNQREILITNLEKLETETIDLFEEIKNEKVHDKDIIDIIEKIQELSINLEEKEKYIKKQVENFLSNERASLGQSKKTSVAAFNYYKIMNNFSNVAPQFFDVKTD